MYREQSPLYRSCRFGPPGPFEEAFSPMEKVMRLLAIIALTVCQFTVVPFLSIIAANSSASPPAPHRNVTVVYETAMR